MATFAIPPSAFLVESCPLNRSPVLRWDTRTSPQHTHPSPPRPPHRQRAVAPFAATPTPPRRPADAVRALRNAMQSALTARHSRLAIRLPDMAPLGIEKPTNPQPPSSSSSNDAPDSPREHASNNENTHSSTASAQARADRELARCVVALFERTGLATCVVFPTRWEMDAARKHWGAPNAVDCAFDFWVDPAPASGRTAARIPRNQQHRKGTVPKGSRKTRNAPSHSTNQAISADVDTAVASAEHSARAGARASGTGFAPARIAASSPRAVAESPAGVVGMRSHDVYVIVSPSQQAMARLMSLCQGLGDDRLVILVNCRADLMLGLPTDVKTYFSETSSVFEDVYLWKPDPCPTFAGGVLFREYPHNYVLCRRTPLGTLQLLFESDRRPTMENLTEILRAEAEKPSNSIFNRLADFLDKR